MIYPLVWRLGCKGEKWRVGRTEEAWSRVCLLTQSQLPLNHSQPIVSTRSFLRPPEMGLFSAGSSAKNFLRESRSTFIAREPKLFPLPSFLSWRPPSANTAGDAGLFAPLASRERSTTMPLGAPSSKGSARYYVGPGSLGQSVTILKQLLQVVLYLF